MRSFLLQSWVTVRGAGPNVLSVTQDESDWLDVGGYADASFIVEVSSLTGTVVLNLEASPSRDEASFQAVAPPTTLSVQSSSTGAVLPTLVKTVRASSTAPLARWLRWRLSAPAGSGTWDATIRIRGAGGRSSFFTPLQFSGCALWLRSDLGITLGTGVQNWADQSGNGNNAAQATGANQPPLVPNQMNGLPAIRGDGTNYWMATSPFTLGAQATLITVVQPSAALANSIRLLENDYSRSYYLGADVVPSPTKYKLIVNNGTAAATTVAEPTTTNHIVTGVYSPTTGSIYANGVIGGSATLTAPANLTLAMYLMAAAAGGFLFTGYMGEVIVYNRALTTVELTQVHRYLGARYGVVVP